jgi:hypothetical protein
MKTTTVNCDKCGNVIVPGSHPSLGAREIGLNTMTDEWEVAGGQEPIADLCSPCVARLRGWVKESPSLEKPRPRRRRV